MIKTKIFAGSKFAHEKERLLRAAVEDLKNKGITPKLVSIVVGDVGGGKFYQALKKKAAQRVGAELGVKSLGSDVDVYHIKSEIERLNNDRVVHGIMLQLPLPENLRPKTKDIIEEIIPAKDVDGLREKSPYLAPTAKAVLEVVKEAISPLKDSPLKVVVVGAKGFEGRKICAALKDVGYDVEGVDRETQDLRPETKKADILISATGSPGIISSDMVKEGAVLIDVGAPRGDIQKEAYKKASFVSPVPGGVGPSTIAFLMENLVEAVKQRAVKQKM